MPELPEVETISRTLLPHIRDHRILSFTLLRESALHPLSLPLADITGKTITNASRRGKLLLLHLADADTSLKLVVHLRMTGRLLTFPKTESPHKHTRCFFDLEGPHSPIRLFFDDARTFGKLLLADQSILEQWEFWRTLGPEPLEMDSNALAKRLHTSRNIKTALMDQKIIAGIGNIYADEALFLAGISPLRPAKSLTDAEIDNLHNAIQSVLRLSISQCGSSIRDYRDANGNAGSFQNSFKTYGQGGKPCKNCGKPLTKIRLGGRATVYCDVCQK